MTGMHALWIPIVVSAVAVFFGSTLVHMVLGFWHAGDFGQAPNEDGLMDAMRPFNIPPGDYFLPRPGGMADMKSDAYKNKVNKGPKVIMTVLTPGMTGMGKNLFWWFIYSLVIGVFGAYVASRALPVGADYLHVFRFVGVSTFLGYSGALWPATIWYQRSLGTTIRSTIDGLLYACLTAGVFGWLWPR